VRTWASRSAAGPESSMSASRKSSELDDLPSENERARGRTCALIDWISNGVELELLPSQLKVPIATQKWRWRCVCVCVCLPAVLERHLAHVACDHVGAVGPRRLMTRAARGAVKRQDLLIAVRPARISYKTSCNILPPLLVNTYLRDSELERELIWYGLGRLRLLLRSWAILPIGKPWP
jgi:hypothetical protein